MIDPARREVIRVLEELSEACLECRFGQMIANLTMLARGMPMAFFWNMEDEELRTAARQHLTDWNKRHAPVG